ncbi:MULTISPECIES: phage tail tube protein [unclassified Serratia (in: enterobacteria)]|uniref:phage tail tube protein n=1 Tax=unclassified Serratia (in: enterobacteria) TaxID=2647522 RepID=UPI003075F4D7
MSQGARHSVYFVKEAISGTTPNTPALTVFRATQNSLDIKISTLESSELRSDAEVSDLRLGTRSVEGSLSAELTFGTFDDLIAAALRSTWTTDNKLTAGVLRQSFTFIDYQADLPAADGQYTIYRGCEINSMSMKVSAEGITTIEFGIIGRTMEIANALPTGATITAATTTAPMDGFSGSLLEGGKAVSVVTEVDLTVENGIESRYVVGSKTAITPSTKRRTVSGTLNTYFEDNAYRKKFINETESNISFDLLDPNSATKKYTVKVPRLKFTEAPRSIDGEGDIMINLNYRGLLDRTVGASVQITRVVA